MTVCMPYCVVDCLLDRLFFHSSTDFPTVLVPYGLMEGKSAHLRVDSYLPFVDDFANVLRAVDCSPYHSFFRSSTSIIPGRFAYPIPQRMAAEYSFLHSSTAFTTRISQQMSADCSFFLSSTAFTTVCAPYCSADGCGLLLLPLVNGFHDGLDAVLLSGWQRISHTSTRQRLSRRIACRIALRMAADC